MRRITTWNNNPRECWIFNYETGNYETRFIVWLNDSNCEGIDSDGNKYEFVYEIENFDNCQSVRDFQDTYKAIWDTTNGKTPSISKMLDDVFTWAESYYKHVQRTTIGLILSQLYECLAQFDSKDTKLLHMNLSTDELLRSIRDKLNKLCDYYDIPNGD